VNGFHPAEEFDWNAFSEEELADRLEKLMETGEEQKSLSGHAQCQELGVFLRDGSAAR